MEQPERRSIVCTSVALKQIGIHKWVIPNVRIDLLTTQSKRDGLRGAWTIVEQRKIICPILSIDATIDIAVFLEEGDL
jgi:hypothetical protein